MGVRCKVSRSAKAFELGAKPGEMKSDGAAM